MSQRYVSRPRSALGLLTTAAALAMSTAVLTPAHAGTAPRSVPQSPVKTAEQPVSPEVNELEIPSLEGSPQQRMQAQTAPEHGTVVAATRQENTEPFSLVGVTWQPTGKQTEVEAEVRVRDADGWTDWEHMHVHADGPDTVDGEDTVGTAPLWVGEADAVEARVLTSDGSTPKNLEISLIDPGSGEVDSATPPAASAQTMSAQAAGKVNKPFIISRGAWGADESLRSRCDAGRFTKTINVAFVHHTAGSNNYSKAQSKALVRGIYAYHTRSRGWCDIGYNFLVDRYGRIFEGRFGGNRGVWKPVYGAHTGGYNNHSFGVSLMGNFQSANPPAAMMNATARIVAWKLWLNYRNPTGALRLNGKRFRIISGHRDAKSTACPGQRVYNRLPWLRQRTKSMVGTYNSPIFKKWRSLGARGGLAGAPFYGEHPSAGGTVAHYARADILRKGRLGAHEVHGQIRIRYRNLGAQTHHLGFPSSDEVRAARGGRANNFQRGRIYWSKQTKAREVYGRIFKRYRALGAAGGQLRLPRTGEISAARGSRANVFQGGRIYWKKQTGAQAVYGKILKRYVSLGAAGGRLRLPTTGEYNISGGRAQKFQGGQIRWNRRTNTTRVIYN